MALRTHIDVSYFNVLRYFVLNLVADLVVRKSLDSFEHFRRRRALHHGQSVSISGVRFDRYNLLKTLTTSHTMCAVVLFLITMIAYAVDVSLEYAVDSEAIRYPIRENVTRVEYQTGMCTAEALVGATTHIRDMQAIAQRCVVLEDDVYRFYRPLWVRNSDGEVTFLCENVEGNKLYEGVGIYHFNSTSGEADMIKLKQALSQNSQKAIGDGVFSLFVVNVSSKDIFMSQPLASQSGAFSNSYFLTKIGNTGVQCGGFVAGDEEQNVLIVQVVGCSSGFHNNGSLVITFGTSLVTDGLEDGALGSAEWITQVAFELRTDIPHYFRGVPMESSETKANALAYASFLSRVFARGDINLNKYAILYRFCDEMQVPVLNGTSWSEEYEFARSEMRVTATVEQWGVVLAACWVVVVTVARVLVSRFANRRNMPNNVFGERQILRRWAEENDWEELSDQGGVEAFLSVGDGTKRGRITATLRSRSVGEDIDVQ
eukprot:TRINITY_DN640_c0_g1_i12.p1 TRINITY_DN640_c0_g1~~TRINITY_DN640_c0_g1_i12.p1  ORF type:complete len:487 (+),score=50.76 TRINITY_DN640_c0_g1_i12:410-1870(+)